MLEFWCPTCQFSLSRPKKALTIHDKPRGRLPEANATCCFGLVLYWYWTCGSVARSVVLFLGYFLQSCTGCLLVLGSLLVRSYSSLYQCSSRITTQRSRFGCLVKEMKSLLLLRLSMKNNPCLLKKVQSAAGGGLEKIKKLQISGNCWAIQNQYQYYQYWMGQRHQHQQYGDFCPRQEDQDMLYYFQLLQDFV